MVRTVQQSGRPSGSLRVYLYLILLEAHCARGQKLLVAVLDGQRQLLVEHLQVPLITRDTHVSSISVSQITCVAAFVFYKYY